MRRARHHCPPPTAQSLVPLPPRSTAHPGAAVPLDIDEAEAACARPWSIYHEALGATADECAACLAGGGAGHVPLYSLDAALLLAWACGPPVTADGAHGDDSEDEPWGDAESEEDGAEQMMLDNLAMGTCDLESFVGRC